MILHTTIKWLVQNINQILKSQKTPQSSSLRASYGVSVVRILQKIDIIRAPYCFVFAISTPKQGGNFKWYAIMWITFLFPEKKNNVNHLGKIYEKFTHWCLNTHFANVFKCIVLIKYIVFNENDGILIQISLKCVPKGSVDNNPALVWMMPWCWTIIMSTDYGTTRPLCLYNSIGLDSGLLLNMQQAIIQMNYPADWCIQYRDITRRSWLSQITSNSTVCTWAYPG